MLEQRRWRKGGEIIEEEEDSAGTEKMEKEGETIEEREDSAGTMKVEKGGDSAVLEQRRWRKKEKS